MPRLHVNSAAEGMSNTHNFVCTCALAEIDLRGLRDDVQYHELQIGKKINCSYATTSIFIPHEQQSENSMTPLGIIQKVNGYCTMRQSRVPPRRKSTYPRFRLGGLVAKDESCAQPLSQICEDLWRGAEVVSWLCSLFLDPLYGDGVLGVCEIRRQLDCMVSVNTCARCRDDRYSSVVDGIAAAHNLSQVRRGAPI